MRKTLSILFVLLTLAFPVSVKAQYYSINVDYGTMEAMSEAFTTEAAIEALIAKQREAIEAQLREKIMAEMMAAKAEEKTEEAQNI